jgi:protease II
LRGRQGFGTRHDARTAEGKEYDTTKLRYGYESFITPKSVFEYEMASGASTLLKQKEVPGGYDRALSGGAD